MRQCVWSLPKPKSYAMNGPLVYPSIHNLVDGLLADVSANYASPISYTITEPPSWVVLSVFSLIGLFVVFHRFWSLRNLDILLVLAFIPGFMLVHEGQQGFERFNTILGSEDSTKDTTDLDPTYSPNQSDPRTTESAKASNRRLHRWTHRPTRNCIGVTYSYWFAADFWLSACSGILELSDAHCSNRTSTVAACCLLASAY